MPRWTATRDASRDPPTASPRRRPDAGPGTGAPDRVGGTLGGAACVSFFIDLDYSNNILRRSLTRTAVTLSVPFRAEALAEPPRECRESAVARVARVPRLRPAPKRSQTDEPRRAGLASNQGLRLLVGRLGLTPRARLGVWRRHLLRGRVRRLAGGLRLRLVVREEAAQGPRAQRWRHVPG